MDVPCAANECAGLCARDFGIGPGETGVTVASDRVRNWADAGEKQAANVSGDVGKGRTYADTSPPSPGHDEPVRTFLSWFEAS